MSALSALLHVTLELFRWPGVHLSSSTPTSSGARPMGPSDEQLVTLWQNGDRRAFELLVQRYQNVAYTVCRRYLARPELAEETAQDVFVTLYRKLDEFRGEASFKSWFYKVLTNHCHNRHKAAVRRKQHLHDSLDSPADPDDDRSKPRELPDQRLDPETALSELQRQQLIERGLEALGEEARMVLLLREGQGLSYDEIGDALGLPAGTVKSRIHRARADLKAEVDRLMGQKTR